ncbi:unnamed protein product [Orchesella dallaii]|uniref:SCP domain-containing protein n=1 Tax=Orchesella dallaii TaxID=48710 RepID=A0ABP1PIH1_9HEXA
MALWTILIGAAPLLVSAGNTQYGLDMFAKAGRGACWVEKLNKLPPIDDEGVNWGTCDMNMKFKEDEWDSQYKFQADFQIQQGNNPDDMKEFLEGAAMNNLKSNMKAKFDQLNPAYRRACEQYVDNENSKPAKDYSAILRDSGDYPFKALAYCMLQTVEKRNGKNDLAALKSHMWSPKSFHQSIIDRENENRKRHGVPALKLDSELNTRAQRYADELASKCVMEHMADVYGADTPDLQYNGGQTGENLMEDGATQGTDDELGMGAANGWYSEINNYPWPQYTGNNARGVIGHFTASVWKSTKLAGYGIGRNPNCDMVLIVARYSPGGNIQSPGMPYYKDNVLPLV